jgi:hypothetical protein
VAIKTGDTRHGVADGTVRVGMEIKATLATVSIVDEGIEIHVVIVAVLYQATEIESGVFESIVGESIVGESIVVEVVVHVVRGLSFEVEFLQIEEQVHVCGGHEVSVKRFSYVLGDLLYEQSRKHRGRINVQGLVHSLDWHLARFERQMFQTRSRRSNVELGKYYS